MEKLEAEVTEEIRKRDLYGQCQESSHGGTNEGTTQGLSNKSFFVDVKESESTEKKG